MFYVSLSVYIKLESETRFSNFEFGNNDNNKKIYFDAVMTVHKKKLFVLPTTQRKFCRFDLTRTARAVLYVIYDTEIRAVRLVIRYDIDFKIRTIKMYPSVDLKKLCERS